MYRKSYRMLALVLLVALLFGTFAAMVPAAAEASGMGGHPHYGKHMKMHTGRAYFKPNQLPNPFTRDFDGDCEWWRYELRGGRYVRVYCPCRFGDQEVDYGVNARHLWATRAAAASE